MCADWKRCVDTILRYLTSKLKFVKFLKKFSKINLKKTNGDRNDAKAVSESGRRILNAYSKIFSKNPKTKGVIDENILSTEKSWLIPWEPKSEKNFPSYIEEVKVVFNRKKHCKSNCNIKIYLTLIVLGTFELLL